MKSPRKVLKAMFCCHGKRKSRRIQGLTLTELAIVLAVVGLIFGAIWATAAQVRARQPIDDSVNIIYDISSNIRAIYTGFKGATPPADIVGQITSGFFPDSVVNSDQSDTLNPWNGDIRIRFDQRGAPLELLGFSIEFSLPNTMSDTARREACLGMVTRLRASATNYAGGASDNLPTATIPLEPGQGGGPSLAFVNRDNAWINVTGTAVANVFPTGSKCDGFAFYYRL